MANSRMSQSPKKKRGTIKADSVDLITKWLCISLSKSGTVAAASDTGFFYWNRSVEPGKKNEFGFKVLKSSKLNIFFGV